jgi:uncharacterized protein
VDMPQDDAPKIEFPCDDYPIKIIGVADEDFRETVLNIVERFAPGFDAARLQVSNSRKGTYQSISLWIRATGPEQLSELNAALRRSDLVKLVL